MDKAFDTVVCIDDLQRLKNNIENEIISALSVMLKELSIYLMKPGKSLIYCLIR